MCLDRYTYDLYHNEQQINLVVLHPAHGKFDKEKHIRRHTGKSIIPGWGEAVGAYDFGDSEHGRDP